MFDFPGVALALCRYWDSFTPEQLNRIKTLLEPLAKEDKIVTVGFLGHVVDPKVTLTADVYPHKQSETVYAWDRKHTNGDDIYWERGVWWRNGEMSRSFKFEECLPTIVNEGLSFIEEKGRKKESFFLYMPLTGPHTPWLPTVQDKGSTELGTYGDFMASIDNVVKRVNDKLKELGLYENTMVIFASDNGGAWEESDIQQYVHQSNWSRRGQKGDAWDGGHHGLGGLTTLGLIGRYWDGFRGGFSAKVDEGERSMAPLDHPRQHKDWHAESRYS